MTAPDDSEMRSAVSAERALTFYAGLSSWLEQARRLGVVRPLLRVLPVRILSRRPTFGHMVVTVRRRADNPTLTPDGNPAPTPPVGAGTKR